MSEGKRDNETGRRAMLMQLTLKLGILPERVMLREHADDEIECVDAGGLFRRGDCHELSDGDYVTSLDETFTCEGCDGLFHYDDNVGDCLCETCHDEKFTTCDSCCDHIERSDVINPDDNPNAEICSDCYHEQYYVCDDCSCETHSDNCRSIGWGTVCEDCYDSNHCEEWNQDFSWTGCSEFDKIGSSRKFGIELEIAECEDYREWGRYDGWGVKTDGSLDEDGREFVSAPMYGNDGHKSIKEMCKRMNDNGCDVTDDCGFHLHIDLTDFSDNQLKSLALAYHYTREFWNQCVSEERRDTYYAQLSSDSKHWSNDHWNREKILSSRNVPSANGRYVWCNWQAYNAHKTVEIRSHEPTTDSETIINWVKAHAKFVDYVKTLSVGNVTRIFGSENMQTIFREMKFIFDDQQLSEFYGMKTKLSEMVA